MGNRQCLQDSRRLREAVSVVVTLQGCHSPPARAARRPPAVGIRSEPMIKFPCPHCDARLKAPPDRAGGRLDCPRCGEGVRVPPPRREAALLDEPDNPAVPRRRTGGGTPPLVWVLCGVLAFIFAS